MISKFPRLSLVTPSLEVLDKTLPYLTDGLGQYHNALIACTLVSSRISFLARRHIYKHIILGPPDFGERRRERLLRTLKSSNYNYGSLIQQIVIHGHPDDLVEFSPYLVNLKILSLLPYPDPETPTDIPSYPDPTLIALHNIVSQPRFIALDMVGYSFIGGAMDLEYVLEGGKNLKHLGLQLTTISFAPDRLCRGLNGYPPPSPRPQNRDIPIQSLMLRVSLNGHSGSVIDGNMVDPGIRWLAGDDCIVDVGNLKKLKLVGNPAWIRIIEVMMKCMDSLEVLEMVECDFDDETAEENVSSLGLEHFMNQRDILDEWFQLETFPRLRNIVLVTIPSEGLSIHGCSSIGMLWLQSILNYIDTFAPRLQGLVMNFNGHFNIPYQTLLHQCQIPNRLQTISESQGHNHNQNNNPRLDYTNFHIKAAKADAQTYQWIHSTWNNNIIGKSSIKGCSKLKMLQIILSERLYIFNQMELEKRERQGGYAYKLKNVVSRCSGLDLNRISVVMRDKFGNGWTFEKPVIIVPVPRKSSFQMEY